MDYYSWKSLVHSSYWDSVTSHILDEDGATAFISTKEGAFIEFHKGVIERSCRTNYCSVQSIEIFFTYHPFKRYFLLRDLDKLIIILDVQGLKVVQVHSGVKKYEIDDFSGDGIPQIQVWLFDEIKEPFILNFSATPGTLNSITTNHCEDFLSNRLQLKLKETKEILDKFIKELEDKRKLRKETLQKLALKCPPAPCSHLFGLQQFFGESFRENFSQAHSDLYPLKIHHRWQTTVYGKWLLGWAVKNIDNRTIYNLKVFLHESAKQRVIYSVKRLNSTNMNEVFTRLDLKTMDVFPSPAVVWKEERVDSELPPGKGCILIAVLPFPEFLWSSKKGISGRLSYSLGSPDEVSDIYSQKFPQFEITARSILDGSILPQSLNQQLLLTASGIAVCKMVLLTVTTGIVPSILVEDLLTTRIGFSHSSGGNTFIHPGLDNAALSGCMIQVIQVPEGFEMHLYARSHEVLCLLVYCFMEACPGSWNITHGSAKSPDIVSHSSSMTLGDCSNSLSKEIQFIIYNLSKWKKDGSLHTLSTDVKSYVNFRKEVTALQKKTDAIFSNFEFDDSKGGHVIYH